MMMKNRRWLFVVPLMLLQSTEAPRAQAAQADLAEVHRLKCSFTLIASGTWEKGAPVADVKPVALSIQFDAIDTQDGTAEISGVTTLSAGVPHITVRFTGDNLHFLAMNSSGSVYLTTVFADRESRAGGKFKAVHTRHEFTEIRLTGYTSRPEQYYGYCEAGG